MTNMTSLIFLFFLGFLLWFWQDSLRARERAKEAGLQACRRCQVQLLDDTVALERIWLRRDDAGQLCLERLYVFEFTDTGTARRFGSVLMLGQRVMILRMEPGDLLIP